ncbi:MAG: DUF494 domain-containing protein [Pseudomonadota bacterium]|jgi:Smg protein
MFEILVYLFQNYFHHDACPQPEQLALKLSAAGFEDEEISEALEWLSGLQRMASGERPAITIDSRSVRCYDEEELAKLDVDCRGFLMFLENAGVLNPLTRELIIERAMALDDVVVSVAKLKVIVLMVLWNQHQVMDSLILEELLSEDDERHFH